MSESSFQHVTTLIEAARDGDPTAASQLVPLLYKELRGLAREILRRRPAEQTLQATALVHEAYLRIVGKGKEDWDGRRQFFSTVARAMQDILVEAARRKATQKRGGDRDRVSLEDEHLAIEPPDQKILEAEEILAKLEDYDARKAEIVRLRFFAGLSVGETAGILGVSASTIERELRYIRAWISLERKSGKTAGG